MALKHNILIVDDEAPVLRLLQQGLQPYDDMFDIHTASNGEEALRLLAQHDMAVIVTDIFMPRMDGFQLINRAKRRNPSARFIVMTAYSSPETQDKARRTGALLFLEKPFVMDDFVDQLLEALRPQSGFTASGLSGFHITDALQLMHMSRASQTLRVKSELGPEGVIALREGEIIHAEMAGKVGEEAFFDILSLEGGEISAKPTTRHARTTVSKPVTQLMIDALRRKDEREEQRRKRRQSQDRIVVGEVLKPAAAEDDDFFRCVDEGFEAYRAGKLSAARVLWEQALALRPDDRTVLFNLKRLDQKQQRT